MSSVATASRMTTAHAIRIQPAVVGLPSQKNVAVHGPAAGVGAAVGDSDVSVVCAAQKLPDAPSPAAVAHPASHTHLPYEAHGIRTCNAESVLCLYC